jgi:uncharacterized membrane protein required for colicin V production
MRGIFTNLVVMLMAVTYFLLAIQAETVTKVLGFIFGGLLTLALIRATIEQVRTKDDA